jgi:lambda repressor-like predicted transcriptional regulator
VTSRHPLDLAQARDLYEAGLSFRQVGREIGYSGTSLARCFKAAGIPTRPGGRPFPTPAPAVDPQELVRLREDGWSFPRLAEWYRLSNDAVRTRYLRAKGLPLRRAEAERLGVPFRP